MNKRMTIGYLDAIAYVLTILAAIPYELGPEANLIPPEWKGRIVILGVIAGAILRAMKSHFPEDRTCILINKDQ